MAGDIKSIGVQEKDFSAQDQVSNGLQVLGGSKVNVLIQQDTGGGDGTIEIQRSFAGDVDAAYYTLSKNSDGDPAAYAVATKPFNGVIEEPEKGVWYRLKCTSYTSGTIKGRLSQ